MQDFWNTYLGAIITAILLLLALVITPFLVIGIPAYFGVKMYLQSPKRLERLAREETELLYSHAVAGNVRLNQSEIEDALGSHWAPDMPPTLKVQLLQLGQAIFADEGLAPEIPPMPALCNTVEGARYRDQLARIGQARRDRVMLLAALDAISESLAVIANAVPSSDGDVLVDVTQFVQPLGQAVQNIIAPFFRENDYQLFKGLRERLNANLLKTHRIDPVFPSNYKGDDVVETYLMGTLLKELFTLRTPFQIPEKRRFEHTHLVAGSGHGKTQTLQYMIATDLKDVERGDKSVVVIDSQRDFINTILAAKHLPPEKIVVIDPEDIAFPVSLNLFSVGLDRLTTYDALEQERLTNSIIELYDFVLGSLLSSGMTAKQSTLFRYVTRLMFHIPDATIHTLVDLMEKGGAAKYQKYIERLSGTPRRFFETEFSSKEFDATKTQVLRRIYGVLENQTFERMFTHPVSKFDMFHEINEGKLILINTSKSLLKEEGTEIFGRFFIALIAQAAQERATLPDYDRLPTMVYIDEAADYFDHNIGVILSQARKYKVGMTLAHQYLGQLKSGLADAFEANTSIKLVGGVSARDAKAMATQMSCDAQMLQDQPTGGYGAFIRGYTKKAVSISFPFFVMENMEKTSREEREAIVQHSRDHYAEPLDTDAEHTETSEESPDDGPEKFDDDDPTKPSPEL